MQSVLSQKEVPYFLTVLIALLGYTIQTASSEIMSRDMIEYSYSNKEYKGEKAVRFFISNLSNDKHYRNLKFSVLANSNDMEFKMGILLAKEPFSQSGTRIDERNLKDFFPNAVNFKIDNLLPGAKLQLIVLYKGKLGDNRPVLNLLNDPADSTGFSVEPDAPLLSESNLETYIAKNNLSIMLLLVLVWIVLIVFYASFLKKSQPS